MRRRFARVLGMLVVLPAVGAGLLGLGLAWGFSDFSVDAGSVASIDIGPQFAPLFGPRHLEPIAIPARLCPYLEVVQVAAGAAQAFWNGPRAFEDLGTPPSDRQLDALLTPLDFSLRVAAAQSPPPLRAELSDAAHQVEIGRALIAYGQADGVLFIDALGAGVMSLSNASDLVGDGCGLPLTA